MIVKQFIYIEANRSDKETLGLYSIAKTQKKWDGKYVKFSRSIYNLHNVFKYYLEVKLQDRRFKYIKSKSNNKIETQAFYEKFFSVEYFKNSKKLSTFFTKFKFKTKKSKLDYNFLKEEFLPNVNIDKVLISCNIDDKDIFQYFNINPEYIENLNEK